MGCSNDEGDIYEYGPIVRVVNLDAPWSDWRFNGNEYEIAFDMPEITSAVCNSGSVVAWVVFDDGYQGEMPYVRHYTEGGVDPVYWTQTINSAFREGSMIFYAASSDFFYDPDNDYETYEPGDWRFRVVITEPY